MFSLLMLVVAQQPATADQAEPVEIPAEAPLIIDILVKQPEAKCDQGNPDEIVVCAQNADNESQRLSPIPNAAIYEKDESKAEFSISENATLAAEVDSGEMAGGAVSKRIMARLRIKF
jgi:hypothetical protein